MQRLRWNRILVIFGVLAWVHASVRAGEPFIDPTQLITKTGSVAWLGAEVQRGVVEAETIIVSPGEHLLFDGDLELVGSETVIIDGDIFGLVTDSGDAASITIRAEKAVWLSGDVVPADGADGQVSERGGNGGSIRIIAPTIYATEFAARGGFLAGGQQLPGRAGESAVVL